MNLWGGRVEIPFINIHLSSFLPQGDTLHLPGTSVHLAVYFSFVDILLIAIM